MKKSFFALAVAAVALVACKKTEETSHETSAVQVVPADSMPVMTDSTVTGNIENNLEGAAQGATELGKDVANGTEKAVDATGEAIKDGAQAVENGAEKAGNAIENGVNKAGNAVENATTDKTTTSTTTTTTVTPKK